MLKTTQRLFLRIVGERIGLWILETGKSGGMLQSIQSFIAAYALSDIAKHLATPLQCPIGRSIWLFDRSSSDMLASITCGLCSWGKFHSWVQIEGD